MNINYAADELLKSLPPAVQRGHLLARAVVRESETADEVMHTTIAFSVSALTALLVMGKLTPSDVEVFYSMVRQHTQDAVNNARLMGMEGVGHA